MSCSKLGRGRAIRSQSSEIIVNVQRYFDKEHSLRRTCHPYSQVSTRVASATGVGLAAISRICKEAKTAAKEGRPFPNATPGKKRKKKKPITKCDSFTLGVMRRKIHQFYLQGELPTLHKLMSVFKEKIDPTSDVPIFNGCIESLRTVLSRELGFKFCKVDTRKHLLERTDVVASRYDFLRKIKQHDLDKVYFLDETWVNQNHTVSKCWQSDDITGVKVPLGKGKRLIVLHAGSSKGFVEDGLLLFTSNSGKQDYHQDMNAQVFTTWFKTKLLPQIPVGSVIVMDNASYHSEQLDKPPTMKNRKEVLQDWLLKNNISFDSSMLKAKLYEIIKLHKPQQKRFVIDELASEAPYFCTVIRLPPYHCQFNPIELIWSNMKQYVASRNHTFKLADIERLTREAVSQVTVEDWKKCVHHVKRELEEYWTNDPLIETALEPFIISVNADSDSDEEYSESENSAMYDYSTDENYEDFENSFTPLDYECDRGE